MNRYSQPAQPTQKVKPLQRDYINKISAVFRAADINGDNELSVSELKGVLEALDFYFSPSNLKLLHKLADADNSGAIELDEFIGLLTYLVAMDEAFKAVDFDSDGRFDRLELAIALTLMDYNFDAGQLELLYLLADDDDSGFIEKEEFATLVLFLTHLKLLFERADKDKSGTLELHEFFPFLTTLELNVPRPRAAAAFSKLDTAGSGSLPFEDIVAFVMLLKYKS